MDANNDVGIVGLKNAYKRFKRAVKRIRYYVQRLEGIRNKAMEKSGHGKV